ncbi:DUF6461 domain-containing protein [Amycolatopsis halotolerans]|uniref:DUF6461 domain-containing protein n=1 Tax=Amycolatopsis halotolerans TaxID=330083 RepID=A0ABV7QMR5_9PSEU
MNETSPVDARYRLDPDWTWLATPAGVVLDGGALTFVRGMAPAEVFRTFDLDPDSARVMTAAQALADPVLSTAGFFEGPQWIRVAESGEWAVVVEYIQQKTHVDGIAGDLARNTDVVFIAANEDDPAVVSYLSHGDLVFTFTCGGGYDSRGGTHPHLFDDEMIDSGLIDFASDATIADSSIALMAILGRHLGLTVTPETVTGPLPTAYRRDRYAPLRPGGKLR